MADHIKGKVIAITGAGGGFGRLISQKAAARGAKIACADINRDAAEATAAAVRDAGGAAIAKKVDVTDLAAMKGFIADAVKAHGAVDVMINNAGVMPLAFYADHEKAADAWSRCIDINIKGVLHGIIAAYDQMIAQGRGHVINLSSIYGNFPVAGAAVYGASKTAVNFLSEALRVESQGKIKVTIVKPTGVPATGLSTGVVNPAAVVGILGQNMGSYINVLQSLGSANMGEGLADANDARYAVLDPGYIADAVLAAIDQPWGVATSDITIRATGDGYIL